MQILTFSTKTYCDGDKTGDSELKYYALNDDQVIVSLKLNSEQNHGVTRYRFCYTFTGDPYEYR